MLYYVSSVDVLHSYISDFGVEKEFSINVDTEKKADNSRIPYIIRIATKNCWRMLKYYMAN